MREKQLKSKENVVPVTGFLIFSKWFSGVSYCDLCVSVLEHFCGIH